MLRHGYFCERQKVMAEIKPPTPLGIYSYSIFLAGSIERGLVGDWQSEIVKKLSDLDLTVLNPRRVDWDSSWKQEKDFGPFREQVEWEMDGQNIANLILMYMDPQTKAPISLMELGLSAHKGKMIVCCPDGFWRKGYVDIVCERYGIPQVETLDELTKAARKHFQHYTG